MLRVFKTDLLRFMGLPILLFSHSSIDGADDVQSALLSAFNTINEENFMLQGFGLIHAA